jgi:hypothetical protein
LRRDHPSSNGPTRVAPGQARPHGT